MSILKVHFKYTFEFEKKYMNLESMYTSNIPLSLTINFESLF